MDLQVPLEAFLLLTLHPLLFCTAAGTTVPEVDCCLTTGEIQQLLDEHVQGQLSAVAASPLDMLAQLLPGLRHAALAAMLDEPAAAMEVDQPFCNGNGSSSQGNGFHGGLELLGGDSQGKQIQQQQSVQGLDQHKTQQQASTQEGGEGDQEMEEQQQHQQGQGLLQQLQQQQDEERGVLQQQEEEMLLHSRPGSSGGYMDFIFRVAAWQLFGVQLPGKGLVATKQLRNADFQELLLQDDQGKTLLRFASAYGFRNIQSLMRKIKGGKCEYDYVEVMACPGGCLNGAGQIPLAKGKSAAQLLEELEMAYYVPSENGHESQQQQQQQGQQPGRQQDIRMVNGLSGRTEQLLANGSTLEQRQQVEVHPGLVKLLEPLASQGLQSGPGRGGTEDGGCGRAGAVAGGLYDSWVGSGPGSDVAKLLLHTHYHHRKKTVASAISDW